MYAYLFFDLLTITFFQFDEDGRDEEFDQYGLTMVLKDYMYADQSTRFQVCKNHFERAVNDAKVRLTSILICLAQLNLWNTFHSIPFPDKKLVSFSFHFHLK